MIGRLNHVAIAVKDLEAAARDNPELVVEDGGSEPDMGEVHFINLLAAICDMGFIGPVGAEYKPRGGSTEASLGWLETFRRELE